MARFMCFLVAMLGMLGAQAAPLKVVKAEWGKDGGPYCDATRGVAQSCAKSSTADGSACQVYASNAYCSDGTNGWHVLKVTYSCNGQILTAQGAEGAQVLLRCAPGTAATTGVGTSATQTADDIAGTWDVYTGGLMGTPDENTSHYHALLAIRKDGTSYSGTLRFDDLARIETLTAMRYVGGELTFTRPPLLARRTDQHYDATVRNNKLTGSFSDPGDGNGRPYKWWGTRTGGK